MLKILPSSQYTFSASSKTITFSNTSILPNQILFISNLNTGTVIYNIINGSSLGTFAANVLTFTASNAGMSSSDVLFIKYDDLIYNTYDNNNNLNTIDQNLLSVISNNITDNFWTNLAKRGRNKAFTNANNGQNIPIAGGSATIITTPGMPANTTAVPSIGCVFYPSKLILTSNITGGNTIFIVSYYSGLADDNSNSSNTTGIPKIETYSLGATIGNVTITCQGDIAIYENGSIVVQAFNATVGGNIVVSIHGIEKAVPVC